MYKDQGLSNLIGDGVPYGIPAPPPRLQGLVAASLERGVELRVEELVGYDAVGLGIQTLLGQIILSVWDRDRPQH